METLNGVSIVECRVWKVCLKVILIRETKKNMSIERWRKPKSNAFDIVCLTLLNINKRMNTQLAQWHLQQRWVTPVCVCMCVLSTPSSSQNEFVPRRYFTALSNQWLEIWYQHMTATIDVGGKNGKLLKQIHHLSLQLSSFWYKWSHTGNYLSPTKTPQNASTFSPKFFSCPGQVINPLNVLHLIMPLPTQLYKISTRLSTFPSNGLRLPHTPTTSRSKALAGKSALTPGRSTRPMRILMTRIPREERLSFMSTKYSERPHQRRREYKGEARSSEYVAERSV